MSLPEKPELYALFDARRASGEYCTNQQYGDPPVETTEVEEGDYPDW